MLDQVRTLRCCRRQGLDRQLEVDSVIEGKYKIHIKKDEEPDRTYGWAITVLDDHRIHLTSHGIGDVPTTLHRKN